MLKYWGDNMNKEVFHEEQKKLKEVVKIVENVIENEKDSLEKVSDNYIGTKDQLVDIARKKIVHLKNLEKSLKNPYFARVDFRVENDELKQIYIGKNGISENGSTVVTDWRAPISSLYYDSEKGQSSYKSPTGIINGNLELKRQYEIENAELLNYFDVDLVSKDELLQKYLNTNNDARLKSIVATIQKEQNDVIRRPLDSNLIIQGVAGSGKTTVALHRIAYLVYNYMNNIKQNQYMVIGPNPVFIKYIQSVLPDLDVSGVTQCTFESFAKNFLNCELTINSSEKKATANIAGKCIHDIDKFKSSMKLKEMLDLFLEENVETLISKDIKIKDFVVVSSDFVKRTFNEVESNSLQAKIELTIDRICKYVELNHGYIIRSFNNYCYDLYSSATSEEEKNKIKKEIANGRKEIDKNCRPILRTYFSKSKFEPEKLYLKFIKNIENYNIFHYPYISELKKETLKNLNKKTYDFEDLASLMYIKNYVLPQRDYRVMRHVVVDEAQDLGEFNYYLLKTIMPNATFSIYGDLAQSIYDYRGVDNWEKVNKVMFDNKGEIVKFNKSYRTTSEIMNVADEVAANLGLGRSDLVVRSGEPVKFTSVETEDELVEYINNKLVEFKEKGYKTIAIISKTNLLSCYINDDLSFKGTIIPNVSLNDDMTKGNFDVCTISNQLAKGLEFDAVIINNANEQIYSSNNSLDMKLLYVAITRALHELDVVYTGELTNVLKPLVQEKVYLKKVK